MSKVELFNIKPSTSYSIIITLQKAILLVKAHFNISTISTWLSSAKRPYVISGPCSAETEEQLITSAKQLAEDNRINVLRAGIWKPRTRPNSFEGVGEKGLEWLKVAGNETNLPIATEVANVQHVEQCLKAGVDILWIGARTTANPFSVQEIANALKGVDIPVLVKNPVNPDVQLWIGALERIHQAGIKKLAAIHRGFSSYDKTIYRNIPMWEIPIALKMQYPEIEIICDPSHIAGNRALIKNVCQKAIDLDMAGIMVESHHDPDNAWSDAQQQINAKQLSAILNELVVRKPSSLNSEFQSQLDQLRNEIDTLDENILQKLATRMEVAEKIGAYKKANNVTILQVKRWDEIIKKRIDIAQTMGLGNHFTKQLLSIIHEESIRKQTDIMNNKDVS